MEKVSIQKAFDAFKPESCIFVISYDTKNRRSSGMIAGWSMKCSTDPFLYAAALWKKGYTHTLIQQTKEFVVAVPNKRLEKALEIFGSCHGDAIDKFKATSIKTKKSKFVKPPLLADATINFECKLEKEVDSGDHIIFIGRIVAAYVNSERKVLLNMGKIDGKRVFKEF